MRTLLLLLALAYPVLAQAPPAGPKEPDWKEHSFQATCDKAYSAAELVLAMRHEIQSKEREKKTIHFHVGMTAWSWGYNMVLSLTDGKDSTCDARMSIGKSGGKAVSWGSGSKETRKIWKWIEQEIERQKSLK